MIENTEPILQNCTGCGGALDVTDEEPLAGVICPMCGAPNVVAGMVGPFELIEALGAGGMGVVYKARDTSLDRLVALKLLHREASTNREQVEKLASEAAVTALINHPHVVRVFTTGMDNGRVYIAMELVDKGTLDSLITLQGRIAEAQMLEVGIQIAQGLRAAYQHGLIHRDIKPGNILFSDARTAKIVDFGLAIFQADEESSRGEVWGTPYYVAPEKLDAKPEDFRSDMYSLGATLFHAVAGRPPFEAENASMVALKHLKSQAVSIQAFAPWVSGPTSFVINRMLSKDPDQRYQSYDELIEHLEYARTELIKKGAQPAQNQRVVLENAAEQSAMGMFTLGLIGLAVLIGLGFAAVKIFSGPGKPGSVALVGATRGSKFDVRFEQARQKLLAGDAGGAAKDLATLAGEKLPQPQLNWTNFHEGLAHFAAGDLDAGNVAFRKIAERGRYSTASDSEKLAQFFINTATLAGADGEVFARDGKALDRQNYESLGLIAYGLKNWHLRKWNQAGEMLREFEGAKVASGSEWVRDYKKIIDNYLSDYSAYREANAAMKMTGSDDQKRAAAKVLDSAVKNLKVPGPLADEIKGMRRKLGTIPPPPPKQPPKPPAAPKPVPPNPK